MSINHTWPVHGYEHCHGSFPLRWFPGSEAVWFDSQRGRDPEAAGETCSRDSPGENGDFTWGYNGII